MAKTRARAQRKRADYRKGGRVAYQRGGYGGYEGEEFNVNVNIPDIPTYTEADVNQAYADLNSGKVTAAQLATQYGVTEDYVNTNLATYNSQVAEKAAAAKKETSILADPVGATKTVQPDADKGEDFIAYNTSPYTSVDDTFNITGAGSAGEADFQWGAAAQGVQEGDTTTLTDPNAGVTTADTSAIVDPMPTVPIDTTKDAATVASIPADGDYSAAETQAVVDAINSGTTTAEEVAAKFGVSVDQINAEMTRQNQVAAGEEVTVADPYAATTTVDPDTGETTETPYVFRDMDAEAAAAAVVDDDDDVVVDDDTTDTTTGVDGTTAADVADIPVDADYTKFEVAQVFDALENGSMTVEQVAAQFGATVAQVQAEWDRMKQVKAGEEVTIPDPFEGGTAKTTTGKDIARAAAEVKSQAALDAVGKDISFKDKAGDEAYVPGSFLKDYAAVDKQKLIMKQDATAIDRTGTITSESAIQQLAEFDTIDLPDEVTTSNITKAIGVVRKAVNDGTVTPQGYEAALVGELAKTIPAFTGAPVEAVIDELRALTDPAKVMQLSEAEAASRRASGVDYIIDEKSWVGEVDGVTAKVSETPEAEAASRAAITGKPATPIEAAQIGQIGFEARQRAVVTGTAAIGAAANAVAAIGELPNTLAEQTVENPEEVAAIIDTESVEVQAAIAALPEEALVSGQMQALLGGMESGTIPTWAKPAVSAVEQQMAARGLGISTVGRDALFNAIIQTALPMAQSNAQALQANAAQNLTNQQQANLEEARLNATRRLSNLANQQTSAAQTAQFAQNIGVLTTQQRQQTALTAAQIEQQTNVQNLQNRQRTAELQSQNQQQINSQELGNAQQIELAELEIKNQTEQQNMTAVNQERLAEMQIGADFLAKNAGFKQQMSLANLSNDQQMRLANLTARNQADAESLSNEQQTELANLNVKMQTNITSANLAAEMNVAQLNVDQQRAITNATTQSKIDLTKFSTAQQVELANSAFMQQTSLANLSSRQQTALQNATAMASLDLATADNRAKLSIENARNFLQIQTANLSNEQQALILDTQMKQQSLLSDANAENVRRQFGATSKNQVDMFLKSQADAMEQFNSTQYNAMEQFNKAESNRLSALDEQNSIDAAKFNAQIEAQVEQFNAGVENQRDIWNASNAQAIEQANTNWRRQANTADTAAINAANAQNVQNSYGIATQELDFIWNAIRDDATFLKKEQLDTANQKTNMYITAMNNESNTALNSTGVAAGVTNLINTIFD